MISNDRIIILSSYVYCKALNNTNLSVFLGFLTGFIANLSISSHTRESIILIICCIVSMIFTILTIKKNEEFNDMCQNIKVNKPELLFREVFKAAKKDISYKKFCRHYIVSFSVAIISFFTGLVIYFLFSEQSIDCSCSCINSLYNVISRNIMFTEF